MTTIKQVSTRKADLIFVLMPEECKSFEVCNAVKAFYMYNSPYRTPDTCIKVFDLPEDKWSIVGFTQELTEEQWKEVLPVNEITECTYEDVERSKDRLRYFTFYSATESAQSLLRKHDIYHENPFGKEIPVEDELRLRWQQVQSNTGNWLMLKKEA